MWKVVTVLISLTIVIEAVIVDITELGKIRGFQSHTTWDKRLFYQFLGVKFAESPSGFRRFRPPEPAEPWKGIYDATKQPIICPQITSLDKLSENPLNIDLEDCLTLNIFTPIAPNSVDSANLLPVIVNIHGGAYYEGSSDEFPPYYLLEKDVILVVPQYRVGPLGFLSLHTDEIAGNAGLMDQLLALKWVNKYIHYFGGDNGRVTLLGQSAGASSIVMMLTSPLVSPDLFQQAILQSIPMPMFLDLEYDPIGKARGLYESLTNNTNLASIEEMQAEFINAPVIELITAAFRQITNPTKYFSIARPVVQKAGEIRYLNEDPNEIIRSGRARAIPMIAGITKNEGSYTTTVLYDELELTDNLNDYYYRNGLIESILKYNGIEDVSNFLVYMIKDKYFKNAFEKDRVTFEDIAAGVIDITGMFFYKSPTFQLAKVNSQLENNTFFYSFDYRGENTRFGFGVDTAKYPFDGGVHHCDDLLYLFPYPYKKSLNQRDTKMAKLMVDLWTSFVIDGAPKSSLMKLSWPVLEKDKNGPFIHLNRRSWIGWDFVDSEFNVATNEASEIK